MSTTKSTAVMRPQGCLTQGLEDFCREFGGGTIVEIGVYRGESTRILSRHFDRVIAIDPWDLEDIDILAGNAHGETMTYDMRRARNDAAEVASLCGNVTLIQAFDHQVADMFRSVDGVYIDAVHTANELRRQVATWMQICRRFVAGHDYCLDFPEVVEVVDDLFPGSHKYADTSWAQKL